MELRVFRENRIVIFFNYRDDQKKICSTRVRLRISHARESMLTLLLYEQCLFRRNTSYRRHCFLFFRNARRVILVGNRRCLFVSYDRNQFGAVTRWSTPRREKEGREDRPRGKVFSEQLCGEPRHYGGVVPEYYVIYNRGWISSILRIFISRDFWRYAAIFRNFACVGSFVRRCANISICRIERIISNYSAG